MMNRSPVLLALVIFGLAQAGPSRSEPPLPNDDPGILVQPRGPVHEAFAKPPEGTANPGPVTPKAPPEPVPEIPPNQKPEGDNVQWLPGYWTWDNDRGDYIWVSGFWRVPPPNRKWLPGYWQQTQDGWQWVAGYWAPINLEQPPLLEKPPDSLDYGPAIPAPNEDSFYIPGNWVYGSGGYLWQPGFWSTCQPGWVWSPAHYCWTPGGYRFVSGYWDRCLDRRGLLFAPVVFQRPLWQQPGWCYRPRYVVNTGTPFFSSFFSRPASGHYYFGDYFDPGYARLGYRPWWVNGPRAIDPLASYYSWEHRDNPAWMANLRQTYLNRRSGTLPRPGQTLGEQVGGLRIRSVPGTSAALPLVAPLSQYRAPNLRLATVPPNQRVELQAAAGRLREIGRQRSQLEMAGNRGRFSPPMSTAPPAMAAPSLSPSRIIPRANPVPDPRITRGTPPITLPRIPATPPRGTARSQPSPSYRNPGPRGSFTPGGVSTPRSWAPPSHMSPLRPSISPPSGHSRRDHRK